MVLWGSLSPDSAAGQEDGLHESVCVCVTVCLYVRVRAQSGHIHNNPSTTPSFNEANDSQSQLCPGRTHGSALPSVPHLKEGQKKRAELAVTESRSRSSEKPSEIPEPSMTQQVFQQTWFTETLCKKRKSAVQGMWKT